jgi:hypothetical protein
VKLSVRGQGEYLACIDWKTKQERSARINQLVRVAGASLGLLVDHPERPWSGRVTEDEMLNVRSVSIVPPIVTGSRERILQMAGKTG